MKYLKQEEVTNSFSEEQLYTFNNFRIEWGSKIDHESYLEGMRSSIGWGSEISKHS